MADDLVVQVLKLDFRHGLLAENNGCASGLTTSVSSIAECPTGDRAELVLPTRHGRGKYPAGVESWTVTAHAHTHSIVRFDMEPLRPENCAPMYHDPGEAPRTRVRAQLADA
jgi:hypothetical protein